LASSSSNIIQCHQFIIYAQNAHAFATTKVPPNKTVQTLSSAVATETKLNANHNKINNNPSIHKFIVAVVNGSYIFRLHKVAIIRPNYEF
jgi:hypothetical protein